MSKRIRIYTAEDVATHTTASSCWVSREGKVYDVSGFINDHPGGDDLILAHAGKDIGDIMNDKLEHEHSDSAYSMLDEYVIGRVGVGEAVVRDGWNELIYASSFLLIWFIQIGRLRTTSILTRQIRLRIMKRTRFWTSANPFFDRSGKPISGAFAELA